MGLRMCNRDESRDYGNEELMMDRLIADIKEVLFNRNRFIRIRPISSVWRQTSIILFTSSKMLRKGYFFYYSDYRSIQRVT